MGPADAFGHELNTRAYYDTAIEYYSSLLPDDGWNHGDEAAHRSGLSPAEAAVDMHRQLVEAARIKSGDLVLDFGSGIGGPVCHMALMSGATFVGVSNNARLTEQARRHAAAHGVADRVFFHDIGDEEYKGLGAWPEAAFDALTYQESVVHLADKGAFFSAAYRVLKPGARLAAVDWVQRPWGPHQTREEIEAVMAPVNQSICIPWHATVAEYREMMTDAGFTVEQAVDLFPSGPCWGSTPPNERQLWLSYEGPGQDLARDGKRALDHARAEGVFSIAKLVALKPNA